jgi:ribonucleoside-diphosphate reductase alpha chain/ribonucleoside-diphosphate reductase subunit M1
MYYLRTRPKADAIQFTVDKSALQASAANKEEPKAQAQQSPRACRQAQSPLPQGEEEEEELCLACSA